VDKRVGFRLPVVVEIFVRLSWGGWQQESERKGGKGAATTVANDKAASLGDQTGQRCGAEVSARLGGEICERS